MLFVVRAPPFFDEPGVLAPCRFGLLVFERTFGSISESTGPEADGGALEDGLGFGDCARDDEEEAGAFNPVACAAGLLEDM